MRLDVTGRARPSSGSGRIQISTPCSMEGTYTRGSRPWEASQNPVPSGMTVSTAPTRKAVPCRCNSTTSPAEGTEALQWSVGSGISSWAGSMVRPFPVLILLKGCVEYETKPLDAVAETADLGRARPAVRNMFFVEAESASGGNRLECVH